MNNNDAEKGILNKLNIMITDQDVIRHKPCYIHKYLPVGWSMTLCEFLAIEDIPPKDRIWIVTRFLPDRENRLFAVWCAKEALKLIQDPDKRSINACKVAELYADGKATSEELARAAEAVAAAATAAAESAAVATGAARAAAD